MRIAIETSCLVARNQTGISRYARELVAHLAERVAPSDRLDLIYAARRMRRRRLLPRIDRVGLTPWIRGLYPRQSGFDVLHTMHQHFPGWSRVPVVRTLHDLYAHIGIEGEARKNELSELASYRELADTADRVICVSHSTRRDFLKHYDFPPENVTVTHLGVGPQFHPQAADKLQHFRERFGLTRPYFLFVGNSHPNKNLWRLLEAYHQSAASADIDWLIVGRTRGAAEQQLRDWIAAKGRTGRIHLAGSIAEEFLPLAYAGAAALLFPSLYEGFGLPILEAMASGTPVMTSNLSSCPEVADGHAVLVDPYSQNDLVRGLDAVLSVDEAVIRSAREYAQGKTWAETARLTLEVYRQCVS